MDGIGDIRSGVCNLHAIVIVEQTADAFQQKSRKMVLQVQQIT